MKTIVIIQARMNSSRLKGKILLPLSSSVVLEYVVQRCHRIRGVDEVIVATSTHRDDDVVVKWCLDNDIESFRGSEDDVLSRYYECAKPYNPDFVIRVTADCPFVDFEMAEGIIETMLKNPSDIVLVQGDLPRGLVVEMISCKALDYIHENGTEPRHREHVTYYAYENPEPFKSVVYKAAKSICVPSLRITLDTEDDYKLCQAIAEHFQGDPFVPVPEIIAFLLSNPNIAALNAHIEQKPVV